VADGAVGSGAARGERADDCPPSLDGLRVLLVDDEADARDVLSAVLEKCGAEVDAVASAADALEAFGRGGFDLVISDIGMPGEDGYTLIGRIRELERRAGAAQTPAVALTAYAREEDRVRAFRAGFQMHLVKPVEPGELTAVVASLAGRAGGAPVPRED
jgi:CheY-like chemotaxis protein